MNPPPRRPIDYYLLWIVAIVSLSLNVYILALLREARQQVGNAAASAAAAVGQLRQSTIEYPLVIDYDIPVSLTVAYQETITVPISVTLPINTQVSVPLRTPLGVFPITVPVVTNIPVNLNPEVPLNVSLPISTTVPVDLELPIRVELAATPLGESLGEAEAYLEDLADQLGGEAVSPASTSDQVE